MSIKTLIMDVDGVLTTGRFFYDAEGKRLKEFGPHDGDGAQLLRSMGVKLQAITADERGYRITARRLSDMSIPLSIVSESARYAYLAAYDPATTAFVGDGYHDVDALRRFAYSYAPADACATARDAAKTVLNTPGGGGVLLEIALLLTATKEEKQGSIAGILHELNQCYYDLASYENLTALLADRLTTGPMIGIAAGRMGHVLRCFITRLNHLGANAKMWGDPNVLSCGPGTIVLVNSSSGETPTVALLASQADRAGATIALITTRANTTISRLADVVLFYQVPPSKQLMKTLPEQFTMLLLDAIVADIVRMKGLDADQISKRHSNLE